MEDWNKSEELSAPCALYAASRDASKEGSQAAAKDAHSYAESSYWEQRFASGDDGSESFDWYVTYDELRDAFQRHMPASPGIRTLVVGSGTSALSAEMCAAGYRSLVNFDIAPSVVTSMRQKTAEMDMEWAVMDGTRMGFRDDLFDLAVEKGTLDALLSDPDTTQAAALIAEVWRTLRPGGLLMLVSHSRMRGSLFDAALQQHHGPDAAWELVEARWNRLSNQATLINLLRARLRPGQSFADGFRDTALLQDVGGETRKVIKVMLLMDLFRSRRLKSAKEAAAKEQKEVGEGDHGEEEAHWTRPSDFLPEEPGRHWEEKGDGESDEAGVNLRKQPYCYLYVLRKRILEDS